MNPMMSTTTDLTFATGVDVFEGDIKQSNSVHRSLMFLFDNEFQHFLRKMLDTAVSTESSTGLIWGGGKMKFRNLKKLYVSF